MSRFIEARRSLRESFVEFGKEAAPVRVHRFFYTAAAVSGSGAVIERVVNNNGIDAAGAGMVAILLLKAARLLQQGYRKNQSSQIK